MHVFAILFAVFCSLSSYAQEAHFDLSSSSSPTRDAVKPILSISSRVLSGTVPQPLTTSRQEVYSTQEITLGARFHESYGTYLRLTYENSYFTDSTLNTKGWLDPSVNFTHPIFEKGSVKINGRARQDLPTTKASQDNSIYKHTYYIYLKEDLDGTNTVRNELKLRYYSQKTLVTGDITNSVADSVTLSHKLSQKTSGGTTLTGSYDGRHDFGSGLAASVTPYIEVLLSKNMTAGANTLFPLYSNGDSLSAVNSISLREVTFGAYLAATL